MGSLLFEIKDNKDELHRVVVSDIGSILTINDDFMTKQVMARKGIEKIKYCLIKPNVENLTLVIRNYTLTDTIYIESFCDVRSDINIFQSIGTNIHMTEQKIQHMQVDCASVFAADCSVEKMEIGIFSVVNQYKNLSGAQENIAYKMDKLELRDMNVGILDLYAECKYINVQRSRINEFNNNGNMLKPYLVKENGSKKQVLKETIFTKQAVNTVNEAMRQVIRDPSGTGHAANIEGVDLRGKTGTAEIKQSQTDTKGTEIGWFVTIMPATNNREALELVSMTENVKKRGGSGYVVNNTKKIMEEYLQ